MPNKPHILFFTPWYPNRYDNMLGLFVRKHAEAVSRFAEVSVLYLLADENVKIFDIITQTTNGVREIYVYFPFCHNKLFSRFSQLFNYWRAYRKAYKMLLQQTSQPVCCQANILTQSGVLAYLLKKKYHIPYVIMEQWCRYLPEDKTYKGFFRKRITEKVVKEADAVMAVSDFLKQSMIQRGLKNNNYQVVRNVVDDFFYERQTKLSHDKCRILHVSCFEECSKNMCGMLRAMQQLFKQRDDFEFIMIGNGIDYEQTIAYAKTLDLGEDKVKFLGEKTPQEVCNWLYQSDVFLLFSNYETDSVVISESLAVGCPIVTTQIEAIAEKVSEKEGVFVPIADEKALVEALNFMIDHYQDFDVEKIRHVGQQYTCEYIGKQLFNVYENAMDKSKH